MWWQWHQLRGLRRLSKLGYLRYNPIDSRQFCFNNRKFSPSSLLILQKTFISVWLSLNLENFIWEVCLSTYLTKLTPQIIIPDETFWKVSYREKRHVGKAFTTNIKTNWSQEVIPFMEKYLSKKHPRRKLRNF